MTRVLVVDDVLDNVKLLQLDLGDEGYDVIPGYCGEDALRLAMTEHPDIILLDLMMPDMSGFEVCRRLKLDPKLEGIPVIMITARGAEEDIIEGLDAGAHDYVVKPFNSSVVLARVRAAARVKEAQDMVMASNLELEAEIRERENAERERNRLETELRHAQKMRSLGQLAAGIAHEINTPIQYISDNTNFVDESIEALTQVVRSYREAMETVTEERARDALCATADGIDDDNDLQFMLEEAPKAVEQTREGIAIVNKIVLAMKGMTHPGTEAPQTGDLNEMIDRTLVVANSEIKHRANVECELGEIPEVRCRIADVNQVLLNLIVNAAQAIGEKGYPERGCIHISTALDGDSVVVRIRDTGPGIPESIRGRIFDPFFTTKEVGKGTGQGLALAHQIIVEKHGGTLDFESEVGVGTEFKLSLPVEPVPA